MHRGDDQSSNSSHHKTSLQQKKSQAYRRALAQSVEPTLLGKSRTPRSAPTCVLWTMSRFYMVRLGGGPFTNSDRVIPKVRARASLDRKPRHMSIFRSANLIVM